MLTDADLCEIFELIESNPLHHLLDSQTQAVIYAGVELDYYANIKDEDELQKCKDVIVSWYDSF